MKNNEFFNEMMRNSNENCQFSQGECRAYKAWKESNDAGLNEIEVHNFPCEDEIHDFIETFKKANVQSFVLTDDSTALMRNIHAITNEGYKFDKTCIIVKYNKWWGETQEIQGIRFVKE